VPTGHVRVQPADGCTPETLDLTVTDEKVMFVQSGPRAPTVVHLNG
jgi:hypothetical protein